MAIFAQQRRTSPGRLRTAENAGYCFRIEETHRMMRVTSYCVAISDRHMISFSFMGIFFSIKNDWRRLWLSEMIFL